MRRGNILWGGLIVLIGGALLLDNLNILDRIGWPDISIWGLIWPTLLIILGVWFIAGTIRDRSSFETKILEIPIGSVTNARINLNHGAGRLKISGEGDTPALLSGRFQGGVSLQDKQTGDSLEVDLRVPPDVFIGFPNPFSWGSRTSIDWDIQLNRNVPLHLNIRTGAGENNLDLTSVSAQSINLKTGASSSRLTLPSVTNFTEAKIRSGAASLDISVPQTVAARIRTSGGLAEFNIDGSRFPRFGSFFQSPEFDTASQRVDINIEMGVGEVTIR